MAGAFTCDNQYMYLSNVRCSVLIEGAIELASEMCESEEQKQFVAKLNHWWQTESWPGIDIHLEERFPTTEEQKFWGQVFQSFAWRVFQRRWGNQQNETWQVDFNAECQIISLMLTRLVWKADRQWYPVRGDIDGIRPDPMRIQQ